MQLLYQENYLQVDAIEYYTQEEANLTSEVEDEKVKALQHPTGIAFVTFDSIENAQLVLHDHRRRCGCGHNPPSSLVSKELKPHNWIIHTAPSPDDIYWLVIYNFWPSYIGHYFIVIKIVKFCKFNPQVWSINWNANIFSDNSFLSILNASVLK